MEQTIFYNVFHAPSMGTLTAVYFFLVGLGSGALLTAVGLRLLGGPGYEKPEKIAAVIAPLAAMGGGLCLFAELEQPMRAWHLLAYFNPASVASWGVWTVNIFIFCSVVYAGLLLLGKCAALRRLGIVAAVFAAATGLYSGVLLYQMRAHGLWHSPLLPVLFLASALASGLASTALISALAGVDMKKVRAVTGALACVLGIDLVLVLVEIVVLLLGGAEKLEVEGIIFSGWYGYLFIGVYMVLGIVVPLLILARSNVGRFAAALTPVLVLAGSLAMRLVIVFGGQAFPLS